MALAFMELFRGFTRFRDALGEGLRGGYGLGLRAYSLRLIGSVFVTQ